MAELIIKDMKLYHEIVDSYNFKTEQLHIDLVAAVSNFHKVQDDMTKECENTLRPQPGQQGIQAVQIGP